MRPTRAEINSADIIWNVNEIRRLAPHTKIIGVVKADAYGHGIIEVADILKKAGVEMLAVAFPDEGKKLRKAGIEGPIFVLLPPFSDDASYYIEYDLQMSVQSFDVIENFSNEAKKAGKKIQAHLFIDSGMRREGILPDDAVDFMNKATKLSNIDFIGVCTHFAAPELSREFTLGQIKEFNHGLDLLKKAGYVFDIVHASNSASIALYPEARYNAVRPGLALYGLMPEKSVADKVNLKPALTLKSKVLSIKSLQKGDTTGYALKYYAPEDTKIAIIPIGYGDGFYRTLTNIARVIIRDKIYPVVGTICMDQLMVKIGNDEIKTEDDVILIGSSSNCKIEAYDIASLVGTIPYEVLTLITKRVPRVYNI